MDNELILDTDVYQSDHRIPSVGKGTLEDDTLPVKYSDGQWENIRKQLDFPASELDGTSYRSTPHTGTFEREAFGNQHYLICNCEPAPDYSILCTIS